MEQAPIKPASPRAERAQRSPVVTDGGSLGDAARTDGPDAVQLRALASTMNAAPHVRQLRALASILNGPSRPARGHTPPAGNGSSDVVQARLMIGEEEFHQRNDVAHLLANDETIGWDDRWGEGVDAMIAVDQDFSFATPKELETFLMNGIFPLADTVDQPTKRQDAVKGKMCFAYSALAAANITGKVGDQQVPAMEAHLLDKNRFSGGGGASTAFRQMGMAPRDMTTYNTTNEGIPTSITANDQQAREHILQCLDEGLPLTAGIRWSTQSGKEGNHWAYVVGLSGNKLHIRDQQNGHVLGTIDMNSWTGSSIDGKFQYTMTKVASGTPK